MTSTTTLHPDLVAVLDEEFGDDDFARELFEEFLGPEGTARPPVTRLVDVAGARGLNPSWPLRRAAVLMIESRLLTLPADDLTGFDRVLRSIAADPSSGLTYPPGPSTLAEGYSTIDPRGFRRELRDRLSRHERIHRQVKGRATSPGALRNFLELTRQESKLTLARYLFPPREVARRILDQVRTSKGFPAPFNVDMVKDEAESMLREWPEYERTLLQTLLAGSKILWVDRSTSSRLNALVECPLGTVVLVIKPPGSHLEFEFKRAGCRGDHPLSVVHERDGQCVPSTHRLDGGSMGTSLRSEAANAAAFGRIYRLIHGHRAPISLTLNHHVIHEVPCAGGRADLLDYFTDSEIFGPGFRAMREAMRRTVRSFCDEWGGDALDAPGELGLTVSFLGQVTPAQAVIGQTSSFRLDLVASYLSEEGPGRYLRNGPGGVPPADEERRFTETLLDEVLGGFKAIEADVPGHVPFIDAVFAVPANRQKADAVFLDLAGQAGQVWGTLYGIKAYSLGESFVGRNVGLRSVWERGRWRVRLVFMDHDMLSVPRDRYDPDSAMMGCYVDVRYILFDPPSQRRSEIDLLASIYRVDDATAGSGREAFMLAARGAYQRSLARLASDPRVQGMYQEIYRKDLLDWEAATARFVACRQLGRAEKSALREGAEVLRKQGRPEAVLTSFTNLIGRYAEFLMYFALLYEPDPAVVAENGGGPPP